MSRLILVVKCRNVMQAPEPECRITSRSGLDSIPSRTYHEQADSRLAQAVI